MQKKDKRPDQALPVNHSHIRDLCKGVTHRPVQTLWPWQLHPNRTLLPSRRMDRTRLRSKQSTFLCGCLWSGPQSCISPVLRNLLLAAHQLLIRQARRGGEKPLHVHREPSWWLVFSTRIHQPIPGALTWVLHPTAKSGLLHPGISPSRSKQLACGSQ